MSTAGQAATRVRRSPWLRGLAAALRAWPPLPRPPSPREAWDAAFRWAWQNRYELLAVAVITGVGAFLRLYRLDGIPAGVTGDEATSGLRADAILQRQWAGPYDRYHAYGTPAGWEFWMAGFIGLFGKSVFAIRLSMAVLAIASLPLAYLFFRAIDGKATAIIGSSLLALSGWHLYFSRIAVPPVAGTTAELLAALTLLVALRSQKWWLFPIAGVVLALGVYVYNGYSSFLLGVAVVLAGWLVSQRAALGRALLNVAVLATAFFLSAWPMLSYIRANQDYYFQYPREASIFNSPRFEEASGFMERTDVILDGGRDFVTLVVFEGARDLPMLAAATSVLLGLGLLYALRRWREPGIALAVILVLLIPIGTILNPGLPTMPLTIIRRSVGVTPFIALLAALPISAALRSKYFAAPPLRTLVLVVAIAAIVSVGVTNLSFYFGDYANSPAARRPNATFVQAARYLDDLPGDPYVYFYSKRWDFYYEGRRFLIPDVQGENRSGLWGSEFSLTSDHGPSVVYIFIDTFLDTSEEVERLYPGGSVFELIDEDGIVLFRAYHREVLAVERDEIRRRHLEQLRLALEGYAQENDGYPDTGGAVQTLCVDPKTDVGCAIGAILPKLPGDPLGSSEDNGYWYVSDGTSFSLIAQQEETKTEGDPCPEDAPRLEGGGTLYCVGGPAL